MALEPKWLRSCNQAEPSLCDGMATRFAGASAAQHPPPEVSPCPRKGGNLYYWARSPLKRGHKSWGAQFAGIRCAGEGAQHHMRILRPSRPADSPASHAPHPDEPTIVHPPFGTMAAHRRQARWRTSRRVAPTPMRDAKSCARRACPALRPTRGLRPPRHNLARREGRGRATGVRAVEDLPVEQLALSRGASGRPALAPRNAAHAMATAGWHKSSCLRGDYAPPKPKRMLLSCPCRTSRCIQRLLHEAHRRL